MNSRAVALTQKTSGMDKVKGEAIHNEEMSFIDWLHWAKEQNTKKKERGPASSSPLVAWRGCYETTSPHDTDIASSIRRIWRIKFCYLTSAEEVT